MSKNISIDEYKNILNIISKEVNVLEHVRNWKQYTPFETLIRTLLSQNTTDKNAFKAFDNLKEVFSNKIQPEILTYAETNKIQNAIRIAGLHKQKSQRIKEISKIIYYKWKSDFNFIYKAPLREARKKLTELPGIGKKTADVLLNFCGKRPIIPVDTHITRIAKRIGLVPKNADYDDIRHSIEKLISPGQLLHIHLSLIFFGRKVCKAIKPQCATCPLIQLCPKIGVKK
ncbi:MAG: endonuclease III domain-containing protein [Promethearchaeota archaeon]